MISKLRTGRPRDNWLKEALNEYWEDILKEYTRNKHTNRTLHGIAPKTPLNLDIREHYYLIKAAANDNFYVDPQAFEVFKKFQNQHTLHKIYNLQKNGSKKTADPLKT